jgi:hypothetical protein
MNLTTTLTSLGAVSLLWAGPFQEPLKPIETPLSAGRAVADFDAAAWAQALRAPQLAQRKANHEELLLAAKNSAEVLQQLRAWAADESDVDLAFTAHLMLRELEGGRRAGALGGTGFGIPLRGTFGPFDDGAFERFFDDLRRYDPFGPGGRSPFQLDLDAFGPGSSQQSSGLSLELGPDGVKVRIEETVDGKSETKTYEAESLEALLEAHPELEGRIGKAQAQVDPRWPFRARPGDGNLGPRRRLDDPRRGPRGLRPIEPSLERLGIQMLPPAERQRSYARIPEDVGLEVVEVVPGSLADLIGIRPGELVTSIAGREIKSAEDVRAALATCSLERRIDVECVTPDGNVRVRSWKPAGAETRGEVF